MKSVIKKAAAAVTAITLSLSMMHTAEAAAGFGDVNGDGKFTIRDVSYIAAAIAGGKGSSLSSEADINRDGKKDVRDAAFMAGYLSKKPTFEEMLKQVNNVRSNAGASALKLDDRLCVAACLRAQEIVSSFSHTRPDNSECFTVLRQYGVSYNYAGENIAAGSGNVSGTMEQWINSPGHYSNMINPNFSKLGVGMIHVPGSYYGSYWVQMFTS